MFTESFYLCTNCWFFLTNSHINTDHILSFLVQDSINGYWSFTSLAVSDDQLTLTTSNWNQGINGLKTSLQWLRNWFTLHNTWSRCFNWTETCCFDVTKTINWLPKWVYYTTNKGFTNWNFHDFSSTFNNIAFTNCYEIPQDNDTDIISFKVLGHTIGTIFKFEQLTTHSVIKTTSTCDTVTDIGNDTSFSDVKVWLEVFNLLFN